MSVTLGFFFYFFFFEITYLDNKENSYLSTEH